MAFRYHSKKIGEFSTHVYMIGFDTQQKNTHWDKPNGFNVIHYVLSGEGYLNGRLVKAGQGFYLPAQAPRMYYPNPQNPWTYMWLSFDDIHVDELLQSINLKNETHIFEIPNFEELKIYVQQLDDQYPYSKEEDHSWCYISQNLIKSYFYKVLSLHETTTLPITNIIPSHLLKAERFIQENYDKNIKISDVADYLNIDSRYLYKLFAKYFNVSPKKYLTDVIISHSMELLANPNFTITQVAAKCGYDNPLQFSSFFKKNTGLSPSEYRRKKFG